MLTPMSRHLVACLALAVPPFAQAQGENLLKAEKWEGSFSYHAAKSGTKEAYGNVVTFDFEGDVQGTFVLDTFRDDTPPTWSGHWTGTAAVHWKTRTTKYASINCAQEEDGDTHGEAVNPNPRHGDIDLRLHKRGWELRIWRNKVPATYVKRCVFPDGHATTQRIELSEYIPFGSPILPYPATGSTLSASLTTNGNSGWSSSTTELQSIPWQGQVNVQPQGDLILEVESPSYETWRPSAAVGGAGGAAPGAPIEFTATLKHPSGKLAEVAIDRMVWELADTSREPGIALNFPQGQDSDFDLKFEVLPGQVPATPDRQVVTSAIVDKATSRARVVPLDWGGWSVLKVTAYVHNGPRVVGRYKGNGENDVRLPKRSSKSFIADAWKKETGATGDDPSDDEDSPVGDGNRGDGLTLYEEYRGFYAGGEHHSGDPKKKDYFVRNEAGAIGEGGIRHFAGKSGLIAHILNVSELDDARVVNKHHASGPHVVDQHGVILKFDWTNDAAASEARGGPGTPGDITFVGLDPNMGSYPLEKQLATTAHELLHTVNVRHHGDGDRMSARWVVYGGELFADSVAGTDRHIQVWTEEGADVTAEWIKLIGEGRSIIKWEGMPTGEHSGFENCLMRYDCASAYPSGANASVRYEFAVPERTGTGLCATGTGVDVNADSHRPQSRYGAAVAGRCKAQIRVNDKYKVH
jgi:hypothetical protein